VSQAGNSTTAASPEDIRTRFIEAALWHGNLERAEAMLQAHPELAGSDIHTAAILGDDVAVRRFLALEPASVHAKSPPYGGDALNYLGLSKYLRLDPARTPGFLRAATALLDAGADPNTGFWTTGQYPERETALYGAAGVAHHPALTRLLLERGADPTDEEVVYHSPEGRDLRAMQAVVETGKLAPDHLRLMLIRKHDWHDAAGVKWLLERGIDLNQKRERGWIPLHHAIERGNDLEIIQLLLDHGADPALAEDGLTAIARAARLGRSDLLQEFERRGIPLELHGVDRLLASCARNDSAAIRALTQAEPALKEQLLADGGTHLGKFATAGNTNGVRQLLDLGVPVNALYGGYGYFDIAPESTALHIAAWMLCTPLLRLLLERGAEVNRRDGKGRTPLALVVKGCVDSYWTEWRSTEPAQALLDAGATLEGVKYPSGYVELDELLRAHGIAES
jgi:ankyrin repeat protein